MSDDRIVAWGDELRRVHARLREALALARESVDGEGDPVQQPVADLLTYCVGFCAALDGHHRSEEAELFPEIVRARPDLAPVIGQLSRDHSMLSYLIEQLRHAVRTGASAAEAHRHLDGIEAVMESHFRYEEKQLVDVLNAHVNSDLDKNAIYGAIA